EPARDVQPRVRREPAFAAVVVEARHHEVVVVEQVGNVELEPRGVAAEALAIAHVAAAPRTTARAVAVVTRTLGVILRNAFDPSRMADRLSKVLVLRNPIGRVTPRTRVAHEKGSRMCTTGGGTSPPVVCFPASVQTANPTM